MDENEQTRAIAQLEANLWSMWSVFGRGPGASLIDEPAVMAFQTPLVDAPYNGVMRYRRSEADPGVESEIDELLAPYRERGVPVMWLVHPSASPADIRERLQARGFESADMLPGMVADLADLPDPEALPAGIDVNEVGADEPAAWIGLVSWRYGLPPESQAFLEAIYRSEGVGPDGPLRVWIASRDGQPVAKAVLHTGAGVAGIYGVATRPEGRGLGLATTLTLTALHAGRAGGCTTGVLHSTPMAVGLYQRLGFERVADFEIYAEPGALHL